jgi:hypothetical protein
METFCRSPYIKLHFQVCASQKDRAHNLIFFYVQELKDMETRTFGKGKRKKGGGGVGDDDDVDSQGVRKRLKGSKRVKKYKK